MVCVVHNRQGVVCVLHFHIPQSVVWFCVVLVIRGLDALYVFYTCDEPLSMSAVCMLHKYQRYTYCYSSNQNLEGNSGNVSCIYILQNSQNAMRENPVETQTVTQKLSL